MNWTGRNERVQNESQATSPGAHISFSVEIRVFRGMQRRFRRFRIDSQSRGEFADAGLNATPLTQAANLAAWPNRLPVAVSAAGPDFRGLFCLHFHCSIQEFEQQLFSRCLHWHVRPLFRLLRRWNSEFFAEDVGLARDVATAASHGEVLTELNRFYGRNVRDRNWLRKTFSLRLSGKRVLRLSRQLFQS